MCMRKKWEEERERGRISILNFINNFFALSILYLHESDFIPAVANLNFCHHISIAIFVSLRLEPLFVILFMICTFINFKRIYLIISQVRSRCNLPTSNESIRELFTFFIRSSHTINMQLKYTID
jgi:hypothetical protein